MHDDKKPATENRKRRNCVLSDRTKYLCVLPVPYPEVRVKAPNKNHAALLSTAYAGAGGELAAVLGYTFGHIMTEGDAPRVSEMLACLSVTEMRHLEMLGKLIRLLGEEPRFYDIASRRRFDPPRVTYATSPNEIVRTAVASEKAAVKHYRELIRRIDDEFIRDVLRRIILDEEHHVKLLTELLPLS